ncbi:MAG: hypothetical protein RI971_980, partial [Chloroflexota bacterium]
TVAYQLVAQRSGDARNREREDDVLDGAAVARLDDATDEFTLLGRVDLAGFGAAIDLLWRELGVAGTASGVDQRYLGELNDLAIRKVHRRLHSEGVTTWVLRNPALLHLSHLVVVRTREEVAALADHLALAIDHLCAAIGAAGHHQAWINVRERCRGDRRWCALIVRRCWCWLAQHLHDPTAPRRRVRRAKPPRAPRFRSALP